MASVQTAIRSVSSSNRWWVAHDGFCTQEHSRGSPAAKTSTGCFQMPAEASANQPFSDVEEGTLVCAGAIQTERSSRHLGKRQCNGCPP
jgi:hypothetical protein